MITGLNVMHIAAHSLNNARALMPQHHGQLPGIAAIKKMHVAMANARGLCANKHLPWAGLETETSSISIGTFTSRNTAAFMATPHYLTRRLSVP